MIKPINGHLIIEPLVHESFISSQKQTYDEIGVVTCLSEQGNLELRIGDKVYFDSWLAARYPKNDTEHFWLVSQKDIRAYESVSE